MKPSDVYKWPRLPGRKGQGCLYHLLEWHLPELSGLDWYNEEGEYVMPDDLPEGSPLDLRIHVDPYVDGDRCYTIGTAWFEGEPVMIFRHAGRGGGKDARDRFITDRDRLAKMLDYIRSLAPPPGSFPVEDDEVCDADQEISALDIFYGSSPLEVMAHEAEIAALKASYGDNDWWWNFTTEERCLNAFRMQLQEPTMLIKFWHLNRFSQRFLDRELTWEDQKDWDRVKVELLAQLNERYPA